MDDLTTKLAEALRPMLDHFCSPAITRYDLKLRDQAREALRLYAAAKEQPEQASEQASEPVILKCEIQPAPLTYPLSDYHHAMSEGPLHYTWQDKPHRLVYDLIAAVRFYAAPVAQAEPRPESEWPKCPSPYQDGEYIGYSRTDFPKYAREVLAAHGIEEQP